MCISYFEKKRMHIDIDTFSSMHIVRSLLSRPVMTFNLQWLCRIEGYLAASLLPDRSSTRTPHDGGASCP